MDLSMEGIRHRASVRSFDGEPLSPAEILALEVAFEECVPGPFGGQARFVLVSAGAAGLGEAEGRGRSSSGKIGTYGLLRRVPAFLVGAIKRGERSLEDFGYAMEGLVLRASDLGLDSCWIGGIFNRSAAARALGPGDDEYMPAIVALGRAAKKQTIAEILVRASARAGTRKPPASLFFDGSFERALVVEEPWSEVLDAVRLGPSASNKQPWRLVRDAGATTLRFHLILEEDRVYNSLLGEVRLQNVDMGIALRHFDVATTALGLAGAWKSLGTPPFALGPGRSYIATWEARS